VIGLILALSLTASGAEAPPASELRAWREAHERFAERLEGMAADTRAWVDAREAEERARIAEGYDPVIAELKARAVQGRIDTIARFQDFLRQHGDAAYASHVRFRLADLLFDAAADDYEKRAGAYFEALEADDLAALERLGEEPRLDLSAPIGLYEQILADNAGRPREEQYERLDGVWLMLAFCLIDKRAEQHDEVRARAVLEELIAARPDSALADRADLFIGNFVFGDGRFAEAIARYERVLSKGPDGLYYDEALYQLAWTHYKIARYDAGLPVFVKLLDLSEVKERESGKASAFAKDALKYVAYSLADRANATGRTADEEAAEFFRSIGPRPYERDVYIELAAVLLRYARPDEAIAVYNQLQEDPRWVWEPDNPQWLMEVVKLYGSNALTRDLVAAGAERVKLTQRYNEGGEWWAHNRNNPKALGTALGYIEDSLLGVAAEYYARAQETKNPADYALAAERYLEYLQKFPIADDYYDQEWLYANVLKESNRFQEAATEFRALVGSERFHKWGDAARYSSMEVAYQRMLATSGAPDLPPATPVVVQNVTTPAGRTIERWELAEDRSSFIDAANALLSAQLGETAAGDIDYRAETEKRRPTLTYVIGQILYQHHRYPEARDLLGVVIERWPQTKEATFAAGLIVDSYNAEGDLVAVRAATKKYVTMALGPSGTPDPKFKDALEGASYKLATTKFSAGDFEGAAAAFLEFRAEFPQSQYAADALHDAAFSYQKIGQVKRANGLYEQFVDAYLRDERSRMLLFRIAANYETTFQLEKAIDYYERLARTFPDDTNRADALFNAAFLRVGLGRHAEAAKAFEAYAAEYPDRPDREEVQWRAGAEYELVDGDKAISFYRGYLKQYGTTVPDHALEALSRIAKIQGDRNDTVGAQRTADEVVRTFASIVAAGGTVGPAGHEAAAAADFRNLQKAFDGVVDDQLTRNDDKDAVLLGETKPAELKAFEERVGGFISRYQSFEHNAGALFLQAGTTLYFADLGLSIEPPPGLPEEEEWAFRDLLDEKVYPQYREVEARGVLQLEALVSKAAEQGRYASWIEAARRELHKRRPEKWPAVHDELQVPVEAEAGVRLAPAVPSEPAEPPTGGAP
jgi:TolA-binding protein